MARRIRIWTWDRGEQVVDPNASPELLAPILETILNGGLWRELLKLPPEAVERLMPRVEVPANVRRVVELWIEEKRRRAA